MIVASPNLTDKALELSGGALVADEGGAVLGNTSISGTANYYALPDLHRASAPTVRLDPECIRLNIPGAAGPGGTRGEILYWSRKSKRRAVEALAAVDWDWFKSCVMCTLTYGKDGGPVDGLLVRKDFDRWKRAVERKAVALGVEGLAGVWKKEFQRRGAPHFHVWLCFRGIDVRGADRPECFWELMRFCDEEWHRIVGNACPDHAKHGFRVDIIKSPGGMPGRYFKAYLRKSGVKKNYQNRVPDGYVNVGRFWGLFGKFPRCRRVFSVRGRSGAVGMSRLLRRCLKSHFRFKRTYLRFTSVLVLAPKALCKQLAEAGLKLGYLEREEETESVGRRIATIGGRDGDRQASLRIRGPDDDATGRGTVQSCPTLWGDCDSTGRSAAFL